MDLDPIVAKATAALAKLPRLLSEAAEDSPDCSPILQTCHAETVEVQKALGLIKANKALQTYGGFAVMHNLIEVAKELGRHCFALESSSSVENLHDCKERLVNARSSLYGEIRLACPGLGKTKTGETYVEPKALAAVNKNVVGLLGRDSMLYLATFMAQKRRPADAHGLVYLSSSEYEEFIISQTKAAHPELKTVDSKARSRIICNCLAMDQALQILGPVGKDLWADMSLVKTEGLVAKGNSIQMGYAASMEVFDKLLQARLAAR